MQRGKWFARVAALAIAVLLLAVYVYVRAGGDVDRGAGILPWVRPVTTERQPDAPSQEVKIGDRTFMVGSKSAPVHIPVDSNSSDSELSESNHSASNSTEE